MKTLHLICNAHLDPEWLWDWEEGAAAAISTFRSAADLAKEFDYVFCHNEAILYQWIEEYDPALFTEIQALVKEGKWRVKHHFPCIFQDTPYRWFRGSVS